MSAESYWVDANVLLRFLTGEPKEMAQSAQKLLENALRGELTLRVHSVTVAETAWVLQSYYGHSRKEITESLAPLLRDAKLRVEDSDVVLGALEVMAEKNVDFADAFLAEKAKSREESVASFDRDFRKLDVEVLEP